MKGIINQEDMEEIITQKLSEIEQNENVKIILAVESGSRAWGINSIDSGYNVRFIYLRNLEFYLKLEKVRDSIECQYDKKLHMKGCNLQKALCLLHESEPTIFEWVNSPILYKTSRQWEKINEKINDYFLLRREFFYYFNMSKSNYKLCLKADMVNVKKLLYLLRSILACKWLVLKNSLPPIEFKNLLDIRLLQNNELKSEISYLSEIKPTSLKGARLIKKSNIINEYIENQFAILNDINNTVKELPNKIEKSYDELDKLFYDILINS